MRLPIQYALSWPERFDYTFEQLDLVKAGTLTFEEPDTEAFPSLKIAVECGKAGGTLPCVFNDLPVGRRRNALLLFIS